MTDIQWRQPGTLQRQLALITQRCGGEIVLLPGDRATLTGTPGEVGQLVAAIKGAGQLVSLAEPVLTGVPGQVLVNVRLAPRLQPHAVRQAAPRRKLPRWAPWAIAGGVVALVAGLGWLVYAAVTAVMENLPVVLLIAGFVMIVLAVVGKTAGGGGGKTFSGTFKGKVD